MTTKTILIIILSFLVVGVIGLNVYLTWQKQANQIPPRSIAPVQFALPSQQAKLKYQYYGELPQLNNTVELFKLNNNFVLNQDRAVIYAQAFGFNANPETWSNSGRTSYFFQNGSQSLLIIDNPLKIEFTDFSERIISPAQTLSLEQLTPLATSFIQKPNLFNQSLSLDVTNAQPVKELGGSAIPVNSINLAKYVLIDFNLQLNSVPILSKVNQIAPIQTLVNLDGSVRKATITLIPDQLESIGTAELTKPEEALAALNTGQGLISKLHNPNEAYTVLQPGEISAATLSSLELVYIYDHDIQQLQPYYRFSGNAQTTRGEMIEVEVLITALPQEVFKK